MATFYSLEASHRPHPHSRGRDPPGCDQQQVRLLDLLEARTGGRSQAGLDGSNTEQSESGRKWPDLATF